MVVVIARAVGAAVLALEILAQHRRVLVHRLERIDQDGQRFVFDLDQLDRVGRHIAVLGDDEGNLLALEQHLFVRQHGLHVAGQGRHVMQVERLQIRRREHGNDARQGERGILGDRFDPRVAVGRAYEIAEQHAGHFDVVDVVALALGEADILDALARGAQPMELRFAVDRRGFGYIIHYSAASRGACSCPAAALIDLTMFW